MEEIKVEMEMLPATNKLVGLAELFDCASYGHPDKMTMSGFIGLQEILLSVCNEISTICDDLNRRINGNGDETVPEKVWALHEKISQLQRPDFEEDKYLSICADDRVYNAVYLAVKEGLSVNEIACGILRKMVLKGDSPTKNTKIDEVSMKGPKEKDGTA